MTREEAIQALKWFKEYKQLKEEDYRIQDENGDWYYLVTEHDFEAFELAIKALEQEPRKGHWISRWYAGHDLHFHVCSECNEEFSCDMETGIGIDDYSFCPNCGSDNREVKE